MSDHHEHDPVGGRVDADVAKFGWHVVLVGSTPEDEPMPPWAYSIGVFRTFNHPEIAVVGLGFDNAHRLVNAIVERVQAGTPIDEGRPYLDFFEGNRPCIFRRVDPRWYPPFCGQAIDFYDGIDFPMLQWLWSDAEGRYPWQADVAPRVRAQQFPLFDQASSADSL